MSMVIANTMVALRLMENQFSVPSSRFSVNLGQLLRTENWELRTLLLLLRRHHCIRSPSVFLELVMQRLQADAENLGRPGLIVRSRLQGFKDELPFRLFNRRTHTQMNGVGIMHRGTNTLP